MALSAAIAISLFLLEFGLVFGWRPGYTAIGVRAVRYAAGHWRQVARPGYRATTEHSLHLLGADHLRRDRWSPVCSCGFSLFAAMTGVFTPASPVSKKTRSDGPPCWAASPIYGCATLRSAKPSPTT
jgi:hypothetical protein